MWYCYALVSTCRKYTYIGKTNNLTRRLRQHNGEISGGAKYTRKGRPWNHILYVQGFPTNSLACCFEWAWKHKRARGIGGVYSSLQKVLNKQKWTRKCPLASTMPLELHYCESPIHSLKLKSYIHSLEYETADSEESEEIDFEESE